MNQEIQISRPLCARNAGVGLFGSALISSLVFILLDTRFKVPGEATLTVARNIGTNVLLLIIIISSVLILIFFNLMVTAASFNAFRYVNKDLMLFSSVFRISQVFFFALSIILLFAGQTMFIHVFLLSHFLYAIHLILFGYIVFKSRFVSRILGISLIIGGTVGYLLESLIDIYLQSFGLIISVGQMVIVATEIVLGITLIVTVMKMVGGPPDPKRTLTIILEELGEATTAEIIDKAAQKSQNCKDRIPGALVDLEKEKRITKRISKEKKAIVWTLVEETSG